MLKYNDRKEEIRLKKNIYYFENLKVALTNCHNAEFYNYIIAFVKPFLNNKIERNKLSSNYSLLMHDDSFRVYIDVLNKDNKLEVMIRLSPIVKNTNLPSFYRKVIFDNYLITLIDRINYENQEEKTTFSLFQNTCQINELGENALICQITDDFKVTNEKCLKRISALRINENRDCMIEEWDSLSKENKYYKANHVFTTFEDALIGEYLKLEKEEVSFKYIIDFINNLPNRNLNCKRKIEEEKQNAPKGTNNLVLFLKN